ncbi:MAG: D-alanyl-D-alanine carboxypeptidase/D-alanyl-D-alanine-endopeptidase [Burkholderiales bacterium]|nr:D-alanyl-D-alanine carboxypeptidase/D-alanyl-D-alanine-endopeptidase [Burkholderiales bacterium]
MRGRTRGILGLAPMPLVAASLRRLAAALVCAAALATSAAAQPPVLPQPVARALARAGIAEADASLFVQEVGASAPVVAFNAAEPMHPASTIKLVTTFAALELLGPTFTWKTEAYIAGPLHDGVLDGDLVLKGHGDPKLTLEDFWLFVQSLRARGLREIRGDLVLDRGYFDVAGHDPGRFDGEPLRAYNVGADALLLNFKTVRFLFVPEIDHGTARIIAEPHPVQLELDNRVKLTAAPCGDWRARLRIDVRERAAGAHVVFSGAMPAACGERYWNVSLLTHPEFVYGVFRQLWSAAGGALAGGYREAPVPPMARRFAVHESATAAELVRDINKYSNNVMARQVFLTLSAEALKLPGRYDRSARAVHAWLAERGLALPELVIENGSGLSRSERISAGGMGRLLLAAFASPVMPELVASLPIVALDGTMKRRLKQQAVAGRAHVKSGSLADARTLAGYVLDHAGRRLVVVFFVGGPNAGASQPAHDAVLRWAYESALGG